MEPELGSRTLDKLDLFLLPIVLLLRLSLLFYALLFPVQKLLLWMYNFCFDQGVAHGLQSELLRSSAYVAYLILCLAMLVLYWLHKFYGWILMRVYYLWMALSYWPQFFWYLFGKCTKGRSVWSILTNPEDQSFTARNLWNQNPVGWICPLWSRYMVFATYQVHGAYAHLYQHWNKDVEGSIVELAGPALP